MIQEFFTRIARAMRGLGYARQAACRFARFCSYFVVFVFGLAGVIRCEQEPKFLTSADRAESAGARHGTAHPANSSLRRKPHTRRPLVS
ncbi:MAG: hypothetical protein WC342_02315 [Methanoregula sp.]|jgi:hypothetical protein